MSVPARIQRSPDEAGFTLIELLVVILIIGILAAIAIPSLLSQRSKAYDAPAKSMAQSAQNAAETIATDNDGSYSKVTEKEINSYETSIPITAATASGGAYLAKAEGTATTFKLEVIAPTTNDKFWIAKEADGEVKRTCEEVQKEDHGCPNGTW